MRNPERIPIVIKAIEEIWLARPDLRLWQIIEMIDNQYRRLYKADPFYVEDDKWLRVIESLKE